MFDIDTGANGGGSKGPWIGFKPKGSAKNGFAYKTWVLRTKDDAGSSLAKFAAMESPGVVLDIFAKGGQLCGSLKLGWSKSDGETGKAPERRWFASVLKSENRPDESKTAGGGFTWRNALSIRAAIGGGQTATWEDDGWGVYSGFSALVKQINAGFAANEGLCPMVRCTGYVDSGTGANLTFVPQFEIVKWVAQPDCLKADAPQISAAAPDTATQVQQAAAATTQAAQQPATAGGAVTADIAF